MKYWFLLLLAFILGGIVWSQRPREEMTCSRPIYGPEGIRPGLYGPGDGPYTPGKHESKHPGCRVRNDNSVIDDGKFSSDTATRNPQYLSVYKYSPPLEKAFPTEGPPVPYLTDFSGFGR